MNFRICRKHCRMTCIRVWTNMDRIGTTPYVVFYMHGSNDRSCTFIIQDRKFSEEFAKDIEDAIQKGEVSYDDGHEGDPACTSRRHVKLLDAVPLNRNVSCFFEGDGIFEADWRCPHGDEHEADYMICIMKGR